MRSRGLRFATRLLAFARRLGLRKSVFVASLGLFSAMGTAAAALLGGMPQPEVHDEFANLLTAQTFAQGALTGPPHPLWQHFETFHVVQRPTHAAKYPPGQGLVLALGIRLADQPAVGLWISAAGLGAALGWALLAWLPLHWAVLVSTFASVHLLWFGPWGQGYWGGSLAAMGGALVVGAAGLLLRRGSRRSALAALALGAGTGLLALTRPFEGLVLVIGGGLFLLSNRQARNLLLRPRAIALGLLPVMVALGFSAAHNRAVTGTWHKLPYSIHEQAYAAAPSFLYRSRPPFPAYRHPELEEYWSIWGAERHERLSQETSPVTLLPSRLFHLLFLLLGGGALGLVGLAGRPRRSGVSRAPLSFALIAVGPVLGAAVLTLGGYEHYAAPALGGLVVLAGVGLTRLNQISARAMPNLAVLVFGLWAIQIADAGKRHMESQPSPFVQDRERILAMLEADGTEAHLVFVQSGPRHNVHRDWVYNEPVIDEASIVWARSLSSASDCRLRRYFRHRKVWILISSPPHSTLTPHDPCAWTADPLSP